MTSCVCCTPFLIGSIPEQWKSPTTAKQMGWIALHITEAKKITVKYYCYWTSSSILFCTINNDDIKITDAFVTSTNRTSHTAAWRALNGRPLIFHCVQMEMTVNQVNKRTAMTAAMGNTSFLSFFFTFPFFYLLEADKLSKYYSILPLLLHTLSPFSTFSDTNVKFCNVSTLS